MSEIGQKLRRAREAAGMNQEDLAALLGIRQPEVSRLELYGQRPAPALLVAWADACGMTVDDLLRD